MPKGTFHPMTLPEKYIPINDMSLQESTNPIITLLTGDRFLGYMHIRDIF